MKHLFTICLLMVVGLSPALSQTDCANGRYVTENLFSAVDVTEGVLFGSNISSDIFTGGQQQELLLDVYEPEGDTETNRPVIILQFGGSFVGGSRTDGYIVSLCEFFAKMGYVAVAPDYRVGLFIPDQVTTTLAVLRGAHDMRATVRYLRKTVSEDGNPYGIDPNRILIGGVSAGAISAVHAAYLDDLSEIPTYMENDTAGLGGIEGISGTPGYSSEVAGVISFSGAIGDSSWIEANDIPIISVHEELDQVVPYDTREVSVNSIPTGLIASGSRDIHERARNMQVENCLYTFAGVNGHTGYVTAGFDPEVKAAVIEFCSGIVCENLQACSETQFIGGSGTGIANTKTRRIAVYPNPTTDVLKFRSEEIGTVEVIDITGRVMVNTTATLGQNRIDLEDLPTGAYVLKFYGESLGTARFIKQ